MEIALSEYQKIPLLDQSKIDQLVELGREIDEDVLSQLSEVHKELTEEILASISDGITKMDPTQIRKAAHKYKSSCGNLGFNRLQKLAFDLELYCAESEKTKQFNSIYINKFYDFFKNEIKTSLHKFTEVKAGAA